MNLAFLCAVLHEMCNYKRIYAVVKIEFILAVKFSGRIIFSSKCSSERSGGSEMETGSAVCVKLHKRRPSYGWTKRDAS